MGRRLPPLNSLRAFEAVARRQSVSGAARELCVTHGAVSRHVAKLEHYLGTTLFVRDHKRLMLSAEGKAYAERLTSIFDHIQEATAENFDAPSDGAALRIGVYPTFASQILIPRLARFREKFPGISLHIATSHSALDPTSREIDVAVRLGTGDWADLASEHLFAEELIPVASPQLLCGRTLRNARDFAPFVLLHAVQRLNDWKYWLETAGIKQFDMGNNMRFESSDLIYQAAMNGLGLAMAQAPHINTYLDAGRLVPVVDLRAKTDRSYFLVYSPKKAKDRMVSAFVQWMKLEVGAESYPSGI